MDYERIKKKLIEMETSALERWGNGDPSGYLEISADDVTYFDPYLNERINGLPALNELYESLRGKIRVETFDLINPDVQISGNVAILTFNYISSIGDNISHWCCTEVYQNINDAWKIIHTHWTFLRSEVAINLN